MNRSYSELTFNCLICWLMSHDLCQSLGSETGKQGRSSLWTVRLLIIWRHMWGRHFRLTWILLASPDVCLCCRVSQKTPWMSCWAGTVMTRWSCEILTTWRSERRRSTSRSSKVWMCNRARFIQRDNTQPKGSNISGTIYCRCTNETRRLPNVQYAGLHSHCVGM